MDETEDRNTAGEPDEAEPGVPGLSTKLEHLFAVVPRRDGGRYTNETAAQALGDAGVRVSGVHLSHLRSGRRNNPSARLLAAIARLFGVPIGYFFEPDTEARANAELDSLRSVSETGVTNLMARTGVSSKNLQHIDAILNAIREDLERERQQREAATDEPS